MADLVGERGILMGALAGVMEAQYNVLRKHGHTPSEEFEVRWNLPFSIGIDTGAVYGGPLTAIRLPDETLFVTRMQNQRDDTEKFEVGQPVRIVFKLRHGWISEKCLSRLLNGRPWKLVSRCSTGR